MSVMDQAAFERALQEPFNAGYESGFTDRDHHGDRNSSESWVYWLTSDEGKAVIAQHIVTVNARDQRIAELEAALSDIRSCANEHFSHDYLANLAYEALSKGERQ